MILIILIRALTLPGDYELGLRHFEKGDYQAARAYFENFCRQHPDAAEVPEAIYYQIRIADRQGDLSRFWTLALAYLNEHRFAVRREEIFNLFLHRLLVLDGYLIAFDFIERYDYINPDSLLCWQISRGLAQIAPNNDHIWTILPQDDSILMIRASHASSPARRDSLYSRISGLPGALLRMENQLAVGDTLAAYWLYQDNHWSSVPEDLLFRYARVVRLFNRRHFDTLLTRLAQQPARKNLLWLLQKWEYGSATGEFTVTDAEEAMIAFLITNRDSTNRRPPEQLNLSSSIAQVGDTGAVLTKARQEYPGTFYLDSLWCQWLLVHGDTTAAWQAIEPYLGFWNTTRFARSIRARFWHKKRNCDAVLLDLILAQDRSPAGNFLFAECLNTRGRDVDEIYQAVADETEDTLLAKKAIARCLDHRYARRDWTAIAAMDADRLAFDPALLRRYALALVRTGHKIRADSIWLTVNAGFDPEYADQYGEYLIEHRQFNQAEALYDSLSASNTSLPERIWYNRALVSFQAGAYDTARSRFQQLLRAFPTGERAAAARFKLASIMYMIGDFDSAGVYYGLAAQDSVLQRDARRNQMISLKKAEAWAEEIEAAQRFLPVAPDSAKAEVLFEIGYAYLRRGDFRRSIDYLKKAAAGRGNPEFHYWLAEAYLGRGDFIHALYHYQTIVAKFPGDEMWAPTADFKCGLTLEFLNALDEARTRYLSIIKKRGSADIWGAEAAKRLEMMK